MAIYSWRSKGVGMPESNICWSAPSPSCFHWPQLSDAMRVSGIAVGSSCNGLLVPRALRRRVAVVPGLVLGFIFSLYDYGFAFTSICTFLEDLPGLKGPLNCF